MWQGMGVGPAADEAVRRRVMAAAAPVVAAVWATAAGVGVVVVACAWAMP